MTMGPEPRIMMVCKSLRLGILVIPAWAQLKASGTGSRSAARLARSASKLRRQQTRRGPHAPRLHTSESLCINTVPVPDGGDRPAERYARQTMNDHMNETYRLLLQD